MSNSSTLLCIASILALSGCQQDGSIGADGVVSAVTSSDDGSAPPTNGETVIVWSISSGSPDYSYVIGRGSVTSTGFDLTLPDPIPAAAYNSYGVGIGIVAAFPEGLAPSDGRIDRDEEETAFVNMSGATPRYAIIYVDPAATEVLDWAEDFPTGFSCGVGVDAPEGETFDSYAPVACDQMELLFGDVNSFDFVNWT